MSAESTIQREVASSTMTRISGNLRGITRWASMILFAGFCCRLLFTTMILQGLPQHPHFLVFLSVIGMFFGFSALAPRICMVSYLGGFPVICALQEMKWIPVGNLVSVCFAALFLGWLARIVILKKEIGVVADLSAFAVNCLSLALLVSSLFSLLSPSVSNSLSVAFSIPSWPEKTEFNALTMGLNATAGCMLFGMIREVLPASRRLILGVVAFQTAGICLFALPELLFNLTTAHEVGRNLVTLPFGVIHNLGGPACLFAGFYMGLVAVRIKLQRSMGLQVLPLVGILVVVVASVSKAAWLAVGMIMLLAVSWIKGWKGSFFLMLLILAMGLILRGNMQSDCKSDSIKGNLGMLLSVEEWRKNVTLTERIDIWKKAFAIIESYPLGGVGLGSFSSIMEHFGSPQFTGSKFWSEYAYPEKSLLIPDDQVTYNGFHCHNDLLEIAVGAGIFTLLLFAGIIAGFLSLAFKPQGMGVEACVASAFAVICFLVISMFDSRLLSFPDNILFWQFVAFIPLALASSGADQKTKKLPLLSWMPLLAPLSVLIGGLIFLNSDGNPTNRTYGVWNWGLPSGNGGWLLAREAQFVIPPDEKLKSLVFQMPSDDNHEKLDISIMIDGIRVANESIGKTDKYYFNVDRFRRPDHWTLVSIEADHWTGTGALGTPFGVKPYAINMEKVRE
jgi:O-antigen ligase